MLLTMAHLLSKTAGVIIEIIYIFNADVCIQREY